MKTTKLLVMIMLLVGIPFAQSESIEDLYTNGLEALNAGNWEAAESFFNTALNQKGDFAPAMVQLAKISVRNGDMNKTKDFLRGAIDAEPENQEYRDEYDQLNEVNKFMSQGARELDAGEYDNAYASYSQVIEKYSYMTEAMYSLGVVKNRAADFDKAVEHFNKALAINPNHEKAKKALKSVAGNLFNEGNNLYRRRDYKNALEYYKNVVAIDNSFYQAYYQMGQVEKRLKNYRNAVKAYDNAVKVKPDFYNGWYGLGLVKESNGDHNGALAAFQKVTEINPGYAKAFYAMGDIYYKTNRFDKARQSCQKAIEADGTYAKPYLILATIDIDNKNYEQALANLDLATALDRKDAKAWYKVSQVQNILGKCDAAKRAARKSLDLSGKFGGAWLELGIAEYCGGAGNKTAALNALEKSRGDRIWRPYAEYQTASIRKPH